MPTLEVKEAPQNIELEQKVLGSFILNDKLIKEYIDVLKKETFLPEQHQRIFEAMLYLYYNNVKITYETLSDRLQFKYKDNMIDYLIALPNSVMNSHNIESEVYTLVEIYQKRTLYEYFKKRVGDDLSGIASSVLVKEVEGMMEKMNITSNVITEQFSDYIDEWFDELNDVLENGEDTQRFKFGFKHLDEIIYIKPSNLILVSARPGQLGRAIS